VTTIDKLEIEIKMLGITEVYIYNTKELVGEQRIKLSEDVQCTQDDRLSRKIALMMEAVSTSETSVNFNVTTWCYIQEDSASYGYKLQHVLKVGPTCL
jgi:hypothetical protein